MSVLFKGSKLAAPMVVVPAGKEALNVGVGVGVGAPVGVGVLVGLTYS